MKTLRTYVEYLPDPDGPHKPGWYVLRDFEDDEGQYYLGVIQPGGPYADAAIANDAKWKLLDAETKDGEETRRVLMQAAAQVVEAHGPVEPEWNPLHRLLAIDVCRGFMYMGTGEGPEGERIHLYKHGITRNYLNLSMDGRAWRYNPSRATPGGGKYYAVPMAEALGHVFEGLEKMGHSVYTPYSAEYRKMRDEALVRAGYSILTARLPEAGDAGEGV